MMRSHASASAGSWVIRSKRRAAPPVQVEQQIDHLTAGRAVEIAGRLVGEEQRRLGRQRRGRAPPVAARRRRAAPDNGAARWARPTCASAARARLEGVGVASQFQRQGDIFHRPSSSATRWKFWKTIPTWSRGSGRGRPRRAGPRSWPATRTWPAVGRSRPAMTISRLVLPEPEGPTRPTASPGARVAAMPRRMATCPAALVRLR